MPPYQYRDSHCGDKTISRPSYLPNGISNTGKMVSLYWIRAQVLVLNDILWIFLISILYFPETYRGSAAYQWSPVTSAVSSCCFYIDTIKRPVLRRSFEARNEMKFYIYRAGSRFASFQCETALLCNNVSHWLGASLKTALCLMYESSRCCNVIPDFKIKRSNRA